MTTLLDKQIFVTDEGAGDPIVMLHGLGGTTSMYQPQATALAARNRVIRIDLEGSGLSPLTGSLSVPGWAEDVAAVLDELGVTGAVFVVHSLSTLVVVELARRRPDLIRSLVAIGPVRSQPDPVKAATRQRAATVRAEGMPAVVGGVMAAAVSDRAVLAEPAVPALVRESVLGQDPEGYAASCEALAAAEEPDWAAIAVPTWLVTGEDDKLSPPATGDAVEQLIRGSRRERVPAAGHWLSVEAPVVVTDAVREAVAA